MTGSSAAVDGRRSTGLVMIRSLKIIIDLITHDISIPDF